MVGTVSSQLGEILYIEKRVFYMLVIMVSNHCDFSLNYLSLVKNDQSLDSKEGPAKGAAWQTRLALVRGLFT